jgi:hypothetical protein
LDTLEEIFSLKLLETDPKALWSVLRAYFRLKLITLCAKELLNIEDVKVKNTKGLLRYLHHEDEMSMRTDMPSFLNSATIYVQNKRKNLFGSFLKNSGENAYALLQSSLGKKIQKEQLDKIFEVAFENDLGFCLKPVSEFPLISVMKKLSIPIRNLKESTVTEKRVAKVSGFTPGKKASIAKAAEISQATLTPEMRSKIAALGWTPEERLKRLPLAPNVKFWTPEKRSALGEKTARNKPRDNLGRFTTSLH